MVFSGGGGELLTTVASDNAHTVNVWDWKSGRRIAEGAGHKGAPPQVRRNSSSCKLLVCFWGILPDRSTMQSV